MHLKNLSSPFANLRADLSLPNQVSGVELVQSSWAADDSAIGGNLFCADYLCSHLYPSPKELLMIRRVVGAAAIIAAVFLPVATQAQGVPGGVEQGARDGERAAGPVGAVVGGVVGGIVGGVTGVLGVDQRPRFRSYVVEQRRPSYQYREDVRVGAVLPEEGVTYYDVPPEYGVRDHRYTVVNGRTVLVEPRTRRIVEIVE
jgi:Protein of unknown function (DUF1236)